MLFYYFLKIYLFIYSFFFKDIDVLHTLKLPDESSFIVHSYMTRLCQIKPEILAS